MRKQFPVKTEEEMGETRVVSRDSVGLRVPQTTLSGILLRK